jgi:hypothetical protein
MRETFFGRAKAEGHVVGFDGLDVLLLVGGAGLHGAFDAGGALLAGIVKLAQGAARVGDDQLQQGVEFAVLQRYAAFAEGVEVCENLRGAADGRFVAGNVNSVGADVDLDLHACFEQVQVFVTRAVQGFDSGCNCNSLFDQSGYLTSVRVMRVGSREFQPLCGRTQIRIGFVWVMEVAGREVAERKALSRGELHARKWCVGRSAGLVGVTSRIPIMCAD